MKLAQLLLIASIFLPNLAAAESVDATAIQKCAASSKNINDHSRCLDLLIDKVDREVQLWINNQTFALEELALKSGRRSALTMFKRAQSTYKKFQQDSCRWQYLAKSPDPKANLVYKKCYILLSISRIKQLKQLSE